ncbi:CYFA0S19e00760g1_1 [Cyberlindnera fabianii]|uniref:CYFA0S19e00760g1_1 n=1 Tax=Cyberlindnera fabianii TaxID=36022 RepID=A0A061BF55_CYBFA|nr:CYFA0S19e00760g1_1 [Cyberlindnera fabianii]
MSTRFANSFYKDSLLYYYTIHTILLYYTHYIYKKVSNMTLPSLNSTLLSEILKELPEETTQLKDSLLGIASKYRSDLYNQLETTHKFQDHVIKTNEKVHKRLKFTVKTLEDHSRRLKVDSESLKINQKLCQDVECLSKQVIGKLMNVIEVLIDKGVNIDGDKYPLLKKVVGQEGFEVVSITDVTAEQSAEQTSEQTAQQSHDVKTTDDKTDETDKTEISQTMTIEDGKSLHSDNQEHEQHDDDDDDDDDDEQQDEQQDEDDEQALLESIAKYKSKQLKPFTVPLSIPSSLHTVNTTSTSVPGITTLGTRSKWNESLRRFI